MQSAAISAVAALVGVALGQSLARSGEYRKWLRAERHRAATELLGAAEEARRGIYARHKGPDVSAIRDESMADSARVITALEAMRLIFPSDVIRIADQYSTIINMTLQRHFDNPDAEVEPPAAYHETRAALSYACGRLIAPRFIYGRLMATRRGPAAADHNRGLVLRDRRPAIDLFGNG
jgi:hypothetical protein